MAKKSTNAGEWTEHEIPELTTPGGTVHNFNDDPVVTGRLEMVKKASPRIDGERRQKVVCQLSHEGETITVWLPLPDVYYPILVKCRRMEVQIERTGDPSDPQSVRYLVRSRKPS